VKSRLGLVAAWQLLMAITPVHAAVGVSQHYDTYTCGSYPDVAVLERAEAQSQRFPHLDLGRPSEVEYEELEYYGRGVLGLVTCDPAVDGYASLVHYSTDGRSQIFHRALPVRGSQTVTLSGQLPDGVAGVTLLLLWADVPDLDALISMAVDPNSASPAIGGVREAYWFPRRRADSYLEPWADQFRPELGHAELPARAAWPWCSARLTAGYQTVTKDCAIDFSGITSLGIDEYGSYGQWRLDWASELVLYCEMPGSEDWDMAEMWLYGDNPQFAQAPDVSLLELEINGWPVRFPRWQLADREETQHIAIDLSQYLHGGSNRIRMRLSSLAGSEWLIHGIEVWMY
jgi:hypothetical protein